MVRVLPYNSSRIVSDALDPDIIGLPLVEQRGEFLDDFPLVIGVVREPREGVLHRHLELHCRSDGRRFHHFHD